VPAGELDSDIARWEQRINDLTVPPGMSPFDIAAFTDRYEGKKAEIRLHIKALRVVKERVRTFCWNYAVAIERQLANQRRSQSFLEQTQNEVNNYFKTHSIDVFNKLQKAAQLIESPDEENLSLLLTEIRRALKASADFFYPPKTGLVKCFDGKERELGGDQYVNRLNEYLAVTFPKSHAKDVIQAEFDYLCMFARRLNALASKGVHAEVSAAEAKQGLLGIYMFLYNIISTHTGVSSSPCATSSTTSDATA